MLKSELCPDNFREAGEEGGEILNLARLVHRTEAVPGPPERGFRVIKRHFLIAFLPALFTVRGE